MLQLLEDREDHNEWVGIRELLTKCYGRVYVDTTSDQNQWRRDYYNGFMQDNTELGQIVVFVPNKMVDLDGTKPRLTEYNNKYYQAINELIRISFADTEYSIENQSSGIKYVFDKSHKLMLLNIARRYNLRYGPVNSSLKFEYNENDEEVFCECRLTNKEDNVSGLSFYWCRNKPCFRVPVLLHTTAQWEDYTLLDFMSILNIPLDYTKSNGEVVKYGQYINLSSYLKSFANFYEHLKCRKCGRLMKPKDGVTNFATKAVNEFMCINEDCENSGQIVYLNHCFNRMKCSTIIDSRDSKQCPNGMYICPDCGACCSTVNFRQRIGNLIKTGGYVSPGLINFVEQDLGHWEKGEFYCFKCGEKLPEGKMTMICPSCGQPIKYN